MPWSKSTWWCDSFIFISIINDDWCLIRCTWSFFSKMMIMLPISSSNSFYLIASTRTTGSWLVAPVSLKYEIFTEKHTIAWSHGICRWFGPTIQWRDHKFLGHGSNPYNGGGSCCEKKDSGRLEIFHVKMLVPCLLDPYKNFKCCLPTEIFKCSNTINIEGAKIWRIRR